MSQATLRKTAGIAPNTMNLQESATGVGRSGERVAKVPRTEGQWVYGLFVRDTSLSQLLNPQ